MPAASRDDQKRRRILDAALAVCDRAGVAGVRMDEVATRAAVSKGTLYRFFESKEELLFATLIESYEKGVRSVDSRLASTGDPVERLERLVAGLVGVLEGIGPRARLHFQAWGVVAEDADFTQRLFAFLQRFHAERHAEFLTLIREGQASGAFRRDAPAEVVAHGLGALLSGFIYRAAFDPGEASPKVLRACFDTLICGTLGIGPGARPSAEVQPDDRDD